MKSTGKKFVTAAGALATGLVMVVSTSPLAHALGQPVITSPTGNLTNGDTVTVSLSDLTPGASYYVGICDGDGSAGQPACDLAAGRYASFEATETSSVQSFRVAKTFVSSHGGPTTITCNGAGGVQCYVVVTQHSAPYPSAGTAVTFN